jgi:hypothetical protein
MSAIRDLKSSDREGGWLLYRRLLFPDPIVVDGMRVIHSLSVHKAKIHFTNAGNSRIPNHTDRNSFIVIEACGGALCN